MAKLKRVIKLKDHRAPGDVTDPELIIRRAIADHLELSPSEVSGDEHLYMDLGVDDAQLPQLLNRMGEALDVRFPDDFFDGVQTVAQLTAAVRVSLSPL